jgi:hypothetical protein
MRKRIVTMVVIAGCHHGTGANPARAPSQDPETHVASLEVVADSFDRHHECVALGLVLDAGPRPVATDAIQLAIVRDANLELRATRALDVIATGYMRCRNNPSFANLFEQRFPAAP